MNISKAKHIHFVGIGGIGVSALAKYFLSKNSVVSGSDEQDSELLSGLRSRGARIFLGHQTENVPKEAEVLIYSDAVREDNPERVKANEQGISEYSYAEALGEIMCDYFGIAVSGTNGKTTTTSILGKILERGELDPFVVVGGKVPGWDENLRLPHDGGGRSSDEGKASNNENQIFIAEACEYRRNMLHFSPKEILLTNIEADHLDYYRDLDEILDAFGEFVGKLSSEDSLFYNADDANSLAVAKSASCSLFSYGKKKEADLHAHSLRNEVKIFGDEELSGQGFELVYRGENLGEFFLPLPGEFNISNALGAVAVAIYHGVDPENIRAALLGFRGTWRRFERIGTCQGATIISDYAHHPTAVSKTIQGAKEFFPDKKVLTVFQPHQKDRTKKLFEDFVRSFDLSDGVILSEIYEVEGREGGIKISSNDLVRAVTERKGGMVWYGGDLTETKEKILECIASYDVVLIMGAGDIYRVAETLVNDS